MICFERPPSIWLFLAAYQSHLAECHKGSIGYYTPLFKECLPFCLAGLCHWELLTTRFTGFCVSKRLWHLRCFFFYPFRLSWTVPGSVFCFDRAVLSAGMAPNWPLSPLLLLSKDTSGAANHIVCHFLLDVLYLCGNAEMGLKIQYITTPCQNNCRHSV